MNITTTKKKLNTAELFAQQNAEYEDKILLSDTVPANSQKMGTVSISTLGDFKCYQVAGHFETHKIITLTDTTPITIDDGMNHLRGQLEDSCGNRKLMNDFIPLNLWLTPGRVIKITHEPVNAFSDALDSGLPPYAIKAVRASASNNLFYCVPFKYLFSANSNIMFNVINDSNAPISYELLFFGTRRR